MAGRVGGRPFVAQVELRRWVVSDILLSLLNDPITTDQRSPRYIPRRLLAPAPAEMALWWDAPTIAFDAATTLFLTVRLSGDVRQPESGRMFQVSGSVRARLRMAVMSDTWRAPYLGLSPDTLDLSGLTVSYAGGAVNADEDAPTPDVRRVGSPLWRLVNEQLITPLSQLPLSIVWGALTAWEGQELRLGAATARAVDAETVALTFAANEAPPDDANTDFARATALDLSGDDSGGGDSGDYALSFSAEGMTQLTNHLLAMGALPQRLADEAPPPGDPPSAGQTTVEELAVTLRAGVVSMIAHLRHDDGHDPLDASVVLDFTCALDRDGALVVAPVDAQAGFLTAEADQRRDARSAAAELALSDAGRALAAAFARELPTAFGQRRPSGPADHPQLPRQAAIPTTSLTRAIMPRRVVVGEGTLTVVCTLPTSDPRLIAPPPEPQSGVSGLPTLPGLTLLAPDEYGAVGAYGDDARTTAIVPVVPAGATQARQASARSAALASSARARRGRRSRLLLALAALALVVAALSGYLALNHASSNNAGAVGLGHGVSFHAAGATVTPAASGGATAPAQGTPGATTAAPGATVTPAPGASPTATVPAASTPTLTLAPGETPTPPAINPSLSVNNTSNSQGCVVALVPPAAFTLTLTNNGGNTVNWQITITQVDSSGTHPWASANEPTGSLATAASATITITPTAASCPGVLGSSTYFLTITASNQDGSGQPETIQVNDVISDV